MTTPLIEAGKPRRKSLPSTEYLRASFDYDREAGVLIYRDRPMETFASARVYRAWKSRHCGKPCGNIHAKSYVNCYVGGEKYHAHRLIWKWLHDDEPYYIDHINGIRSDNRAENLRAVTSIENAKNNAMRNDNETGVVGVFHNPRSKSLPWIAAISEDRDCIMLGRFAFFEDAVMVRRAAEKRYGYHENHGRSAAA